MIFNKSTYKILKLIYENHGIRLSEVMRRAHVSARTLQNVIEELKNNEIITEEKIIGGKKILIRNFYANLKTEEGICAFSLIEFEKKREFFNKHKNLLMPFRQLNNNFTKIKVILILGSFANYSENKDSDLDILLLGDNINKEILKKEIERAFVTFNGEISPRIDSLTNFKRNKNEALYQTIIKNHVLVKGVSEFIKID